MRAADADLTKRAIESKSNRAVKYAIILFFIVTFAVLLTFGCLSRALNRPCSVSMVKNEFVVKSINLFARFFTTPVIFNVKFIATSILHKGRTTVIKVPLIRYDFTKRELKAHLVERAEGSVARRLSEAPSISEGNPS